MLVDATEREPFASLGVLSDIPRRFGVDFYWIAPGWKSVGVQRKAHSDLISSMTDGRLPEQVMQMQKLGLAVVLVEGFGSWTPDGLLVTQWGRTNVRREAVRKFLWKLQARGIWIIQSDNEYDTVRTIQDLHAWTTKEDHSALVTRTGVKSPLGGKPILRERQEWFLTGIDKVGPKTASDWLDANGGVMPVTGTMSRKELLGVSGIGVDVADRIITTIGGPPDAVPDIRRFTGKWSWLSNFWTGHPVPWREREWTSAEHVFQAMKTDFPEEQEKVRLTPTPARAKTAGQKVTLRPDWETVKLEVMMNVLRAKFTVPELREKLLATRDAHLEEGNTHGDTYWGTVDGVGENWLGRLLMEVRAELREVAG